MQVRAAVFVAVVAVMGSIGAERGVFARAPHPDLAGTWVLNRQQSQLPTDVGFGMIVPPDTGDATTSTRGGGRGGRGGGGPVAVAIPKTLMESPEEAALGKELVENERTAPSTLVITQTEAVLTVTDDHSRKWTYHPGAKEDIQQLVAGPIGTTTKWDGAKLVVDYSISKDRKVRYTYSREAASSPLVVEVQFLEKGKGDAIKRVYDMKTK
jgi:hypothetical protein